MTTCVAAKKIVIIGATSGIGRAMAEMFAQAGYCVGVTGRRTTLLEELKSLYPGLIYVQSMDVCSNEAAIKLQELIVEMGGMDILFVNSGYGKELPELDPEVELQTVNTNVTGFTQLVAFAYNYFKQQGSGQIAVTSSVASVRGLRQAPAYSASKRYMRHYVDCLAQRAHHEKLNISFTTLMPGFIATDFLTGYAYPLVVPLSKVRNAMFRAIVHKKREVYLPFRWKIIVVLWRFLPKWIWERYW